MSPLRTYVVEGTQQGSWSEPSRSFVEIVPENVYLAGFKTAEDGDGVILRLHEGAGLATKGAVKFNLPGRQLRAAIACDGRERNGSNLKTDGGSLRLPLNPFETSTVRVRFS